MGSLVQMTWKVRSAIRRRVRSFAADSYRLISKPRQCVGEQSGGERLRPRAWLSGRAIDAGNCCASPSATHTFSDTPAV